MAKISVFLDPKTHKRAKIEAMDADPPQSLSQFVAALVTEELHRRRASKTKKTRHVPDGEAAPMPPA